MLPHFSLSFGLLMLVLATFRHSGTSSVLGVAAGAVETSQVDSDAVDADSFNQDASAESLRRRRRRLDEAPEVVSKDAYMNRLKTQNRLLFEYVPELKVLGPTHIPPPTSLIPSGVAVEEPKIGQHRTEKDAVVAFAAEYTLESFVTFIESLRETGFEGDVVLAVSSIDLKNPGIYEYLSSSEGVVVYSPNRTCYNLEGEAVESAKGCLPSS
jgi:hypothetical protein